MRKISELILCLDLSEYDQTCVEMAHDLTTQMDSIEHIYLYHNIRLDYLTSIPELTERDYQGLTQKIKTKLKESFIPILSEANIPCEITVEINRRTTQAILQFVGDKSDPLLILGVKQKSDGGGIVPQNLLTSDKNRTPTLFCPKGYQGRLDHLLVAVDLTNHSNQLINDTLWMSRQLDAEITSLFVCKLPVFYFPYLNTDDQKTKNEVIQRAQSRYKSYIDNLRELEDVQFEMRASTNISKEIIEFYYDSQCELLVLNRISNSNLTQNRMGGVTRRIINQIPLKPVIIL